MSERKPYRTTEPTNDAMPPVLTMEEWQAQEQARDRRLGEEVRAADARTRAEYDQERQALSEPVRCDGRYETQAWRDSLKREAQFDAQGLSDDMPENPVRNDRLAGNVR